jgi:hypothetical protein
MFSPFYHPRGTKVNAGVAARAKWYGDLCGYENVRKMPHFSKPVLTPALQFCYHIFTH